MRVLGEDFGNPSSAHSAGDRVREAMVASREAVAKLVGAEADQIVFMGSGTEANNPFFWHKYYERNPGVRKDKWILFNPPGLSIAPPPAGSLLVHAQPVWANHHQPAAAISRPLQYQAVPPLDPTFRTVNQ